MRQGSSMRTTIKHTILPILACCAIAACDKSGAEAQREADNAVAEGNTKTTNAQVEADKKVAAAESDFAKTREDYRHDIQSKLDDLDKKIADLDAKSMKATGRSKAKLDTYLPNVHAQRDAFAKDFASLRNENALTWDASKARIDKEWTALKDTVDKAD
jgi:hypothetical protein